MNKEKEIVSTWYSVKRKTPPVGPYLLLRFKNNGFAKGWVHRDDWYICERYNSFLSKEEPTHWMELPNWDDDSIWK